MWAMAERRSIGRWTRLTREFQLSCSLAGAPISRRKLPQQQQQQRSQQNIRSFQHDPVCLHAPINLIKRNKQVLGSRFWNRFLDQTVPVPEYSSTRHTPSFVIEKRFFMKLTTEGSCYSCLVLGDLQSLSDLTDIYVLLTNLLSSSRNGRRPS